MVPKPAWKGRRPPEKCYQDPENVPVSAYDMYMFGIIVFSMAIGVDVPHIDKKKNSEAFEMIIRKVSWLVGYVGLNWVIKRLKRGYLSSGRVEDWMDKYAEIFKPHFKSTFGEQFGDQLFIEAVNMLSKDPMLRPTPDSVLARLRPFCLHYNK